MRRFLTDQRQDSGSSPPGCRRATGRCLGADTGNNCQGWNKFKTEVGEIIFGDERNTRK